MAKKIIERIRNSLIELSKHHDIVYLSGYVQALLDWETITVYEYTKLLDQIVALEIAKIRGGLI